MVVTHTPSEGLGAIGRTRPELVILDLILPDGDRVDLCRQLRQAGPRYPS